MADMVDVEPEIVYIDQLFKPAGGAWMRWTLVPDHVLKHPDSHVQHGPWYGIYYDYRNQLEIYAPRDKHDALLKYIYNFKQGALKPTFVTVHTHQVTFDQWKQVTARRKCLFASNDHPTAHQLMAMYSTPAQNCDDVIKNTTTENEFDGVHVEDVENCNPDQFDDFMPQHTSGVWMAWCEYSNQSKYFLYKDSEDNFIVFSTSDQYPGVLDQYIKVKLPRGSTITLQQLAVARVWMYRHNNKLEVDEEQLDDMITRIVQSQPGYHANSRAWGESLYGGSSKPQSQSRGPVVWTYKTVPGKTPMKPKFYFNPRPLRKGMSTMGILYNEFSKLTTGNS
jgi:hypothetical protein